MYVTNFKVFYILPITQNYTSLGILFHLKMFYFVLDRYKDTSLSEIECISPY